MNDAKPILEKILTLINYHQDKGAFVKEFMNLCMQNALEEYIELLSERRQKEFQQILKEKDPEKLKEELEPYTTTEEFTELLEENTQKLFQDYFETILPTLTEKQKDKLDTYFNSLISDQHSGRSHTA